ncbi:MAG: class I SAM-dependent methyltransferase [Steroidobacteraceae bacterium]
MTPESHTSEYHDAMVAFLEWIWGRDFMAPGGAGNVDKMVEGIDLAGKYGAQVTGIDLEPQLIERATSRAAELGLSHQTEFRAVSLGPFRFPDASFDVVFTSGALTQTEDKAGIVAECLRVLKPGGGAQLLRLAEGRRRAQRRHALLHPTGTGANRAVSTNGCEVKAGSRSSS